MSLQVHRLERVDSTNDAMARRWADGAPDGTVLIAARQDRGRGRRGRSWHTGDGGDVHRSGCEATALSGLTLDVAVVVAEAIGACLEGAGVPDRPVVKWPNDVLVGGRKIAGVLCELHMSDSAASVVVGVGVNVNVSVSDLPDEVSDIAVSLRSFTGRAEDADALAVAIAEGLHRRLAAYEIRGCPDLDAYHRWFGFLGAQVSVEGSDVSGKVQGVDVDGALRVERSDGAGVVAIRGGVVRWQHPVGEMKA
jgi:BirA family biotin operon repressor/biotin-[acetyl-CoA-carboxylase] ligase